MTRDEFRQLRRGDTLYHSENKKCFQIKDVSPLNNGDTQRVYLKDGGGEIGLYHPLRAWQCVAKQPVLFEVQ